MPSFLILKLEGDDPCNAKIVALVNVDGEAADAVKQGYVGDGRYAVLDFDERVECDLAPGAVEVADVEDKATRAEAAQIAAETEPVAGK